MYIDTHCHLNFKAFKEDLDEVIDHAKKAGVEKIIIPGAKIDSSKEAVRIAQKYPNCFAAVGIHPHHAENILRASDTIKLLAQQPKVVAIGEIGLDYYQYKNCAAISATDKENQANLFLAQLQIAYDQHKPVILHCREAFDGMLNDLNHFILKHQNISGVFHCFSGNKEQLNKVLYMGFFAGFDGNITYPENSGLRELIKIIPLDRLLVETDSPYLTPIPYRGQRNTPSNIPVITGKIAEIKHLSIEEIAKITFSNATKLFHL